MAEHDVARVGVQTGQHQTRGDLQASVAAFDPIRQHEVYLTVAPHTDVTTTSTPACSPSWGPTGDLWASWQALLTSITDAAWPTQNTQQPARSLTAR